MPKRGKKQVKQVNVGVFTRGSNARLERDKYWRQRYWTEKFDSLEAIRKRDVRILREAGVDPNRRATLDNIYASRIQGNDLRFNIAGVHAHMLRLLDPSPDEIASLLAGIKYRYHASDADAQEVYEHDLNLARQYFLDLNE